MSLSPRRNAERHQTAVTATVAASEGLMIFSQPDNSAVSRLPHEPLTIAISLSMSLSPFAEPLMTGSDYLPNDARAGRPARGVQMRAAVPCRIGRMADPRRGGAAATS